ncbi:MAG: nucleotide-binding protein [Ornithinimicrobium sp.]
MTQSPRCQLFIGSSSEGRHVARALQAELLPYGEVVLWDQGVFEPGGYTLDSLISMAHRCDFAVLVATPDDTRESRGQTASVPRDNVILEFGLFAGVLGRDRTYVLATEGTALPTDTLGLTRLAFHNQENPRAAVSEAADQVRTRIRDQGPRGALTGASTSRDSHNPPLEEELKKLAENAHTQGWKTKNTKSALRLVSPKGKTHTLPKSTPEQTREALRPFVAQLRASGLRVSTALRRAPAESPFS